MLTGDAGAMTKALRPVQSCSRFHRGWHALGVAMAFVAVLKDQRLHSRMVDDNSGGRRSLRRPAAEKVAEDGDQA